jgi:hypothetical protein
MLAGLIVIFSILTIAELWVLKHLGFDIVAHLRVSSQKGSRGRFYFEAFGVVAFVLFQPALLVWLLAWLSNNINPEILRKLIQAIKPLLPTA